MKSIKEKAEESLLGYDEVQAAAVGYGFILGANYVLDEIEKMMPSSDDVLENHTKCKSAIFRLQTVIEQLKK